MKSFAVHETKSRGKNEGRRELMIYLRQEHRGRRKRRTRKKAGGRNKV